MLKLQEYLNDTTNLVEIHLLQNHIPADVIDINIEHSDIEQIKSKFKNWKTTKYISYHRNHLIYQYDLTDDNQLVYTKLLQHNKQMDKIYISSYNYSKLPIYIFPCVKDINYVNEHSITECKISNRISLMIKKDTFGQYLYIEYKHSPNVDIEKIESSINNIIKLVSIK